MSRPWPTSPARARASSGEGSRRRPSFARSPRTRRGSSRAGAKLANEADDVDDPYADEGQAVLRRHARGRSDEAAACGGLTPLRQRLRLRLVALGVRPARTWQPVQSTRTLVGSK